jgi:hypothetical protein
MYNPVFVFGALRSGTTVFRLMLNAHPEISNPGEANVLFDHLKNGSSQKECIYNFDALADDLGFQDLKLVLPRDGQREDLLRNFIEQLHQRSSGILTLTVHRNLDKIARFFPNSRLIHLIRDPRDVAKSCIEMGWAGNTYFGIDSWTGTERNWDIFSPKFDATKILQVQYEELISSPERVLKEVCSFLDLRYSDSMLSYSNSSTYSAPNSSLIEAWRKRLSAREISLVEVKVGSLLTSRGYKPSGYPVAPPGWIERIWLSWQNRLYRWRFMCDRYGLASVTVEKLSRRILPSLHKKIVVRMNAVTRQHLK